MGKAAIDLPDPLESISPGGSSSVDDLLAQMAGEEIDRLLSEADDPHEKPDARRAGAGTSPLPYADPLPPTIESPAAIPAPISGGKFVATEHAAVTDLRVLAEKPADEAMDLLQGDEQLPTEIAEATTIDERSGLEMPASDAELETFVMLSESPDSSLPIYLKPLEWLSAPLEICPDALRELIGKIALLTTFNAAAVLLYVLIFRKH